MRHRTGIGAAVIGGGFVGRLHIEALRRLGIDVCGLLGSTPERGTSRAAQLGVPKAYATLHDLLADPAVNVVHVTSPNHLHARQVAAILAAGRHVVCEKPLAMSSVESAELVRQAASCGVVNAMSFNLRFYPLNLHASETIRRGGIGTVRLLTGHYLQDWLLYDTDWNWRLDPERGGDLRAVADIGSHWLDLAAFLTGSRIEEVMADLTTFIPVRYRGRDSGETFSTVSSREAEPVDVDTEDAASILLRFEGGARGSVALSQVSAGRKNSLRYQVDGSTASLAWDSEQPEHLWIGHRDRANELLSRDPALLEARARSASRLPGGHVEGFADTFSALFAAVYQEIVAGSPSERPSYPTIADGHATMLVAEAVAESSRTGRWTRVARERAHVAKGHASERATAEPG
jgi:predicted dehydrogenase